MPTIEENFHWARAETWSDHGEEWSSGFGDSHMMWHGFIMPRIARHLPCANALEIACGHGRCTRFLAMRCERLWAVDLTHEVVEACRQRLSVFTNIEYAKTDGKTLPMIPDASLDFAFSWDSLVHAEADVLDSYVAELARTLRPGGCGFLHHSNLGAHAGPDGVIAVANKHWRAESMTAARFRDACARVGLVCLAQELIPWGGAEYIDCFSSFLRPASPIDHATVIRHHSAFLVEAGHLRQLNGLYAPPPLAPK